MQAPSTRCKRPLLCVLMAVGILSPLGRNVSKAGGASQSVMKPSAFASGQSEQRNAAKAGDSVERTFDACTLLSKSVIEAVQGEPVKEAKSSQAKGRSVIISQCFYALPTFANSISLAVTLPDPADSSHSGPRDLWEERFHGAAKSGDEPAGAKEKGSSREEKEGGIEPVAVSGLGDEAYWIRSFSEALYVLKGNAFLRISVAGKKDDSVRLKKARKLAKDALQRMP